MRPRAPFRVSGCLRTFKGRFVRFQNYQTPYKNIMEMWSYLLGSEISISVNLCVHFRVIFKTARRAPIPTFQQSIWYTVCSTTAHCELLLFDNPLPRYTVTSLKDTGYPK